MDFALAEGAKARGFLGRFCLFFLLLEIVELVDEFYDEEQADCDGDKVDYSLKEQTIGNLSRSDDPLHIFVVVLLGNERKKRHYNAVDERVDNRSERRADNHTNGEIDDVSFECEGLEFIPHFFHGFSSLPCVLIYYIIE